MPLIAKWIAFAGWAGLIAAGIASVMTLFAPARGLDIAGALAYIPHAIGALLTIGAAEALSYLAEIAHEARRARSDREEAERRSRENPDRWKAG